MAAGLGFKDFTTGEVLTAADVDGYLMQGIWVFANATARDAAVTSPQEGNACYLKDTDVIQVYTGSTWAAQSASNPISANIVDAKGDLIVGTAADTVARLASSASNGNVLTVDTSTATGLKWAAPAGGGKVLQVVNATYSTEVTSASATFADTGLSATITPTSNTSKILVLVDQVGVGKSATNANAAIALKLLRDATDLIRFEDIGTYTGSALINYIGSCSTNYLDSPATTSAITYKTQLANRAAGGLVTVQTTYGSALNPASTITLMEIGA